jgi:hypothetical protein
MKVKKALERVKEIDKLIKEICINGSFLLTSEHILLLNQLKERDYALIKRYPTIVETRHKSRSRKSGEGTTDYWRESNELYTQALLKEITEYLARSGKAK